MCVMPPHSDLCLFTHSSTRERVGLAAGDTKRHCLTSLSLHPVDHSRSGADPVQRTTLSSGGMAAEERCDGIWSDQSR